MFIGAKMLAEPWIHISTGISLTIVGSVIAISVLVSIIAARWSSRTGKSPPGDLRTNTVPLLTPDYIQRLADPNPEQRAQVAYDKGRTSNWFNDWLKDGEFHALVVGEHFAGPRGKEIISPRLTIGIAVQPETFERIRTANGSPPLADAPPDQDVAEFELEFTGHFIPPPRLDILTTNAPGGDGAIARFLNKFGEGIQQVEIDVNDVNRATEILHKRFQIEPIYPTTRSGANGTRVNFFLVASWNGAKVLVELVEH
jgi:hypothetical protein